MNTKHYKVKFDGTVAEGLTKGEVKKKLSSLYNIDERKIEQIFSSNSPTVLKKNMSYQTAIEFEEAFKKAGAICTIYETTNQGEDIPITGDEFNIDLKHVSSHTIETIIKPKNNGRVSLSKTMGWAMTIAILIASLSVSYYFLVYMPKIKKEAIKSVKLQAKAIKREKELKINQAKVTIKNAAVYKKQGYAYSKAGEYQKAIEAFDHASRIDPNDSEIYLQRGNAYHRLGNSKRAIEDFNLAIRLDPENVYVYHDCGKRRHFRGQDELPG